MSRELDKAIQMLINALIYMQERNTHEESEEVGVQFARAPTGSRRQRTIYTLLR